MLTEETEKRPSGLYYEAKFNLAASCFKHGQFGESLKIFGQLLTMVEKGDKRLSFKGRDRRLYYNKALCELQMGFFDKAVKTCGEYLKPIKQARLQMKQLEQSVK